MNQSKLCAEAGKVIANFKVLKSIKNQGRKMSQNICKIFRVVLNISFIIVISIISYIAFKIGINQFILVFVALLILNVFAMFDLKKRCNKT